MKPQTRRLIDYPIPLSYGFAYLRLPIDITRAEAERLKGAIDQLVICDLPDPRDTNLKPLATREEPDGGS